MIYLTRFFLNKPLSHQDESVCKMSALSLYILCSRTLNLRKTSLWFIIQMKELKKKVEQML